MRSSHNTVMINKSVVRDTSISNYSMVLEYNSMNIYYVYEYLREDMTPYYVGKGKKFRWRGKHNVVVPPIERIRFVATGLSETDAFKLEMELIKKYGRKDLGTGLLRNLTSGGEGATPGPELRKRLSDIKKGKIPWNKGVTGWKCKPDTGRRSLAKAGDNHPYYGKTRSIEEREKISKGTKESWDRPLQTCPHCGKQGKVGMTRWHFDKCKYR